MLCGHVLHLLLCLFVDDTREGICRPVTAIEVRVQAGVHHLASEDNFLRVFPFIQTCDSAQASLICVFNDLLLHDNL